MEKERLRRAILTTLCAFVLSFAYVSPAAAQTIDLGKPLLLVAVPALGGLYHHKVLVAVPSGNDTHIGLILNGATRIRMETIFPDHPPSAKVVEPVYYGGPIREDAILALLRRDPGGPSLHLFDDLFLTANVTVIDKIIEQTPNGARYFVGFVGWRPGELASELETGYWHAFDADTDAVLRKSTDGMWEEFVQKAKNGI